MCRLVCVKVAAPSFKSHIRLCANQPSSERRSQSDERKITLVPDRVFVPTSLSYNLTSSFKTSLRSFYETRILICLTTHVIFLWIFPADPSEYPGRCDFESNMCSYTQAVSDFPWIRTSGAKVIDKEYAPSRDHTTNNVGGSYMLADFLGRSDGDVARFASPTFEDTGIATLCEVNDNHIHKLLLMKTCTISAYQTLFCQ